MRNYEFSVTTGRFFCYNKCFVLSLRNEKLEDEAEGAPLSNQFLPVIDLEKFADVAILAKESKS